MKDLFQKITERWFLSEPLLFAILCAHDMAENGAMQCKMRSGKGRIEYNPALMRGMSEYDIEILLKSETIRILLKHPYERKPSGCSAEACATASDCVITSHYGVENLRLATPELFGLQGGQHYEWYAQKIQELLSKMQCNNDNTGGSASGESKAIADGSASGDESGADEQSAESSKTELWEEDELQQIAVNDIVKNVTSWGSLSRNLVETIVANTKARVDYRKVLSGFCASIISSRRNLTRMRPNRRTEFESMGSVYRFKTHLLVAVDVSSSVDNKTLCNFYSVISRFFRYGVEDIDIVQFDAKVSEIQNIKKASHEIMVTGRGGTSFQPVIDLAAEKAVYDGLIIFTDGYAPKPKIPEHFHTRILWICDTPLNYETHKEWMRRYGRACMITV